MIYLDIYPSSEYFKKYADSDIIKNKYEYEYNSIEEKNNDGSVSIMSKPYKLKDNNLTINELKQKIKLNLYKNDPILIVVTVVDNTAIDPINKLKIKKVLQFYGLVSHDENNQFSFEDKNNNTIQILTISDLK
jgi:hypothetical protein